MQWRPAIWAARRIRSHSGFDFSVLEEIRTKKALPRGNPQALSVVSLPLCGDVASRRLKQHYSTDG